MLHSQIYISEGILYNHIIAVQIVPMYLTCYTFCEYQSLCCPVKTTRAR